MKRKKRAPMSPEEETRIVEMARQGKSSAEIGAALGIKAGTVRQALTRIRRGKPKPKAVPVVSAEPTMEKQARRGRPPKEGGALKRTNKRTVVFLEPDLHTLLRIAATIQDSTNEESGRGGGLSQVVNQALKEYFERHPLTLPQS